MVEAAARKLRSAILAGDLRPGAAIRVRALEETLGISHIPIREALRRLEAEGLVVTRARRTPVVAEVNMLDLNAVYDTRRLIELPTALRARESANEADFSKVLEAYAAYERVATDPGSTEYWQRHTTFHWALLEGGATSWTRRTLDPLWTASERYVRLFVYTYASAEETLCLHKALLDAFFSSDVKAVVRELEHHFDLTVRGVEIGFSRSEDSDQAR